MSDDLLPYEHGAEKQFRQSKQDGGLVWITLPE